MLDPYMGGGTTVVEAMIAGRRAIGSDLNSLAVFITKVKTTPLNKNERQEVALWLENNFKNLSYLHSRDRLEYLFDKRTKNLNLLRSRFLKKLIAVTLNSLETIQNSKVKDFIRCALLKTGQWALDGRKKHTSLDEFRAKLANNISEMLEQIEDFKQALSKESPGFPHCKLIESDAALIDKDSIFASKGLEVDLVVTSPPYPGLHILYHRWQVDGRRETPAPYWIAGCQDGKGDSYYNFGNRQQPGLHKYFESSLRTLKAIRRVMRNGAFIVQMLAFKDPEAHLPRYLANMKEAGFTEAQLCDSAITHDDSRIWRDVPNRKWHAALKGNTSGSREVVLIHRVR